ncbi:hypothetical protein M0813_18110 [Anaeramoeba flamelloides]|uniref:Uncharacterized protein n=1 Tax=Anaeramoeba flamelloides TaxID=1746091 RepID=A0ABQ8YTN8_9EUKA|nr:hypothetical protein M0813_18110 [Anaeramoeba flamelloides]
MKFLFILILILSLISLGHSTCVCPYDDCNSYSGNYPSCLCYCNEHADEFPSGDTLHCNYSPSGDFAPGDCSLCGTTNSFNEKQSLNIQTGTVSIDSSIPFEYYTCICPISCSGGYGGTYEQCKEYCQRESSYFLKGVEKITYTPFGDFSQGECKCCGHVDPCVHH